MQVRHDGIAARGRHRVFVVAHEQPELLHEHGAVVVLGAGRGAVAGPLLFLVGENTELVPMLTAASVLGPLALSKILCGTLIKVVSCLLVS